MLFFSLHNTLKNERNCLWFPTNFVKLCRQATRQRDGMASEIVWTKAWNDTERFGEFFLQYALLFFLLSVSETVTYPWSGILTSNMELDILQPGSSNPFNAHPLPANKDVLKELLHTAMLNRDHGKHDAVYPFAYLAGQRPGICPWGVTILRVWILWSVDDAGSIPLVMKLANVMRSIIWMSETSIIHSPFYVSSSAETSIQSIKKT